MSKRKIIYQVGLDMPDLIEYGNEVFQVIGEYSDLSNAVFMCMEEDKCKEDLYIRTVYRLKDNADT